MKSTQYKLIEFFLLFIVFPISLALNILIEIKLVIGVLGFAYIVFVLLRVEKSKFRMSKNLNWIQFWKHTFFKLIVIAVITTAYVWFTEKEALFNMLLNKPKLWLFILFVDRKSVV